MKESASVSEDQLEIILNIKSSYDTVLGLVF